MGQSGSATAPTASGGAADAAVASAAPLASLVYATSGPFSQFALRLSLSFAVSLSVK